MNTESLRHLYEQGASQHVLAVAEKDTKALTPKELFYVVASLIDLGRYDEANQFLERGLHSAEDETKADLLALGAFTKVRKGDFHGYLEEAQRAVELVSTPLTLYHLGLAQFEPLTSLRTLEAALVLAETAGDRHAAMRNAFALSVPLLRLGRYREALHWTRYATLHCQHEGLRLAILYTQACIQILLGETGGLEVELRRALDDHQELYPWIREPLLTALADLYQAENRAEEAYDIYQAWLAQAPRSQWARFVHGAVRALVTLDKQVEARTLAETALTVADHSVPNHRASALLTLGVAWWPEERAVLYLETALMDFTQKVAPAASEAALHLAGLSYLRGDHEESQRLLERLGSSLSELGESGRRLLGGRAFQTTNLFLQPQTDTSVYLLGRTAVLRRGRVLPVRPRGFEILALLLTHSDGLSADALGLAVYDRSADQALRVELHRLKRALDIEVSRHPYQLRTPLTSDLANIWMYLREGKTRDAVRLYRGPLLPHSRAPGIVDLRRALETQLVAAVLAYGDLDLAWNLAQIITDDLDLWEQLLELPKDDPRLTAVKSRVAFLHQDLSL